MTTVPKINVHRYPDKPNRKPEPDDFLGMVEPEDRKWAVYYYRDGSVSFAGHRNPETGAIIDDESPIRYFTIWRHSDPTGVSGTGLVAYGYERFDGKADVHWLGQWATKTTHERGMDSVVAIHGHVGATSVRVTNEDSEISLPCSALPIYPTGDIVLTAAASGRFGWVVGIDSPCDRWEFIRGGPDELWQDTEFVAPPDRLVHGDLIEGIEVNGERHMFWEDSGRMRPWSDVVRLLALRPTHLLVTRLLPSLFGEPGYVLIPMRWASPAIGRSGASA